MHTCRRHTECRYESVTHACASEMTFLPVVVGLHQNFNAKTEPLSCPISTQTKRPILPPPWGRPWSLSLKGEAPAQCRPVRSVFTFKHSEASLESGSLWKPERLCGCDIPAITMPPSPSVCRVNMKRERRETRLEDHRSHARLAAEVLAPSCRFWKFLGDMR